MSCCACIFSTNLLCCIGHFSWNICFKPKSVSFFEKKVNLTTTRINFGSSPRTFLEVSRIHVWDPTHKVCSQQYTYMYFTCFCLIDMFMRKEVSKLEAKDSTMGQDFFWGCISITCLCTILYLFCSTQKLRNVINNYVQSQSKNNPIFDFIAEV